MPDPARFESRRLEGGAFATRLFLGDRSCDVGEHLARARGVTWDPLRETPLDALLQSGAFRALLPGLAAAARDGGSFPAGSSPAPPVVRPGKILALGRTYREHALELGNAPPDEPLVFQKLPDTMAASGAPVSIPARAGGRMDHEGELALIVSYPCRALPDGNGTAAIAAVMVANDLTLRSVQKAAQKAGHPWLAAKNFPGSCALGPFATAVEPWMDLDRLEITCRVNGAVRQHSSTAALTRPVGSLVEWVSQWCPLAAGDLILTGTPAGTGPLATGDVCEVTITGAGVDLGKLVTRVA